MAQPLSLAGRCAYLCLEHADPREKAVALLRLVTLGTYVTLGTCVTRERA